MAEHTQAYIDYLQSNAWKSKRAEKLSSVGHKCAEAGDVRYRVLPDGSTQEVDMCSGPLHVHHLTYANLGNEPLSDLRVLCEWHHRQEHKRWRSKPSVSYGLPKYAPVKLEPIGPVGFRPRKEPPQ